MKTMQIEKVKKMVPELRFKHFEGNWTKTNLENITKYVKGFAFKSENYRNSGVRIVRVSDLATDIIKNDIEKVYIEYAKL